MSGFLKELRLSLRSLARQPGPTTLAVLMLGLGIGLVATVCSIIWGTLLRGLPYPGSERLMRIATVSHEPSSSMKPVPLGVFNHLRESQTTFDGLAAWLPVAMSIGSLDLYPEQVNGAFVSGNIFDLLEAEPILGRRFAPEEDEGGAVVIIGERLWKQQLGGKPDVLGRIITVYGEPKTVIGVMPEEFRFPYNQEVWVSLDRELVQASPWLQVFGRLREDVSRDRATSEMATLAASWRATSGEDLRLQLEAYELTYHDPQVRRSLKLAFLAVGGLFLIACANVMNILLARGASRSRELTIRVALGASRWQITRQTLLDSLWLALGGATLALFVAQLGVKLYQASEQAPGPYWVDVRLDATVFATIAATTVVAALFASLGPALWATSPHRSSISIRRADQAPGRREGLFRHALVVGQFALSTGLLIATGLMIDSVADLTDRFRLARPAETQVLRLATRGTTLDDDPVATRAFYAELERRLGTLPEIEHAGLASGWPGGGSQQHSFELDRSRIDAIDHLPVANWISISPGYFDTFALQPVAGREFQVTDRYGSEPVAILSQSFAKAYGVENMVGRRLRLITDPEHRDELPWRTIVGVVPDLIGPGGKHDPVGLYLPIAQTNHTSMMAVLRPRPGARALERKVRHLVQATAPDTPIYFVKPLESLLSGELRQPALLRTLFSIFGGVALLMASIGLYGVMTLSVGHRARELGLRLALGALPHQLLRLVLGQGLRQLMVGAAFGLLLASWLGQALASLYQVNPWNPRVLAVVLLTLTIAGLTASWYPARRAARSDPTSALRHE